MQNHIYNPSFTGDIGLPDGWTFSSPRDVLRPGFSVITGECQGRRLKLFSKGDRYAIGCWTGRVELEKGRWYRASVRVSFKNIDNPDLSVYALVAQHLLRPRTAWREETLLEVEFRHDDSEKNGDLIALYIRSTENGSIEWYDPQVIEIPVPKHQTARIASIKFGKVDLSGGITLAEQRERIKVWLNEVGSLKPDLVIMTEFCQIDGVEKHEYKSYDYFSEHVPGGPTSRILSEVAREHGMYIIAGMVERRGFYLFNTAVIFDRKGNFIGQYDKTHLTFNEMADGLSCGDTYPLFDLDFGRIGIHICYDEWFPEVSKYYALKGADVLFLLVAGGKPITWRTRAIDNGIYFVSASMNPPSMIIDSSGVILAETDGGIACADLNLDFRKVNWYGDPTLSYGMPCIVPQMRNTLDNGLFQSLADLYIK